MQNFTPRKMLLIMCICGIAVIAASAAHADKYVPMDLQANPSAPTQTTSPLCRVARNRICPVLRICQPDHVAQTPIPGAATRQSLSVGGKF